MAELKNIMYLTGQHYEVPSIDLVSGITHVILAFMPSSKFLTPNQSDWGFFSTVSSTRTRFSPTASIMIGIGGWGDTTPFSTLASSPEGRLQFAVNIKAMLDATGADGVDIDWEYPGGNGEDYKQNPNPTKSWEIDAYPLLLQMIRDTIGPNKILSAAVPGLPRDMLAFTPSTIPAISKSVDFLNIMTYDLMNRRSAVTSHHAGIAASRISLEAYLAAGLPAAKANLGFAFYVKWFRTQECQKGSEIGCPTVLLENKDGSDTGESGAFCWHDPVPSELQDSFTDAMHNGLYDAEGGGHYYWDPEERVWWTWEGKQGIERKTRLVGDQGLGGVFAWGLGEDAPRWEGLKALTSGLEQLGKMQRKVEL